MLFDKRRQWRTIEDIMPVDRVQVLRNMIKIEDYTRLLDERFLSTKQTHPKPITCLEGKTDEEEEQERKIFFLWKQKL